MQIYERGLANLRRADSLTIKDWIAQRALGINSTSLDSAYTSSRMETSELIEALYQEGDSQIQQKLQEALVILLSESTMQGNFAVLSEVLFSINRIDFAFPTQVLLDFVINNASNDTAQRVMSDAIALLFETSHGISDIENVFDTWFWMNPIPCGNTYSLLIFSGLLNKNPESLPKLLPRMMSLNENLSSAEQFGMHEVLAAVVDNCTDEILQSGLSTLSENLQNQLLEPRRQHPDLFNCQ